MINQKVFRYFFIFVLVMGLLSWPHSLSLWMPYWGILFILVWEYLQRDRAKLPTVFLLGLLTDIFSAGVLGVHALSYVIITVVFQQVRLRFNFYTLWQQSVLVALLAFVHVGLLYGVQTLWVHPPSTWPHLGSVLSTALVWLAIGGWVQNKSGYFTNIPKIQS